MKKVDDCYCIDIIALLFELSFIILILYKNNLSIEVALFSFMIFTLSILFFGSGRFVFMYNNELLRVYNTWFPWLDKTYYLSDIKSIEVVNAAYRGGGIRIVFKSNKKKIFITCIKNKPLRNALEEISYYLNSY